MESQMYHYATVRIALEELTEKGFNINFNVQKNRIIESIDNFKIVQIYRYENQSDPSKEATIFGIKSNTGEKGIFVVGITTFGNGTTASVLNELYKRL